MSWSLALRVLGIVLGVALFGAIAFILGFVFGEDAAEASRNQSLDTAKPGDRRLDPETGCDALATGIRALVLEDGGGRHPPEVRAVLLDGLLLNYRNLDCGIDRRTRLLLELAQPAKATAPATAD